MCCVRPCYFYLFLSTDTDSNSPNLPSPYQNLHQFEYFVVALGCNSDGNSTDDYRYNKWNVFAWSLVKFILFKIACSSCLD